MREPRRAPVDGRRTTAVGARTKKRLGRTRSPRRSTEAMLAARSADSRTAFLRKDVTSMHDMSASPSSPALRKRPSVATASAPTAAAEHAASWSRRRLSQL
jgi:hypothetical protein